MASYRSESFELERAILAPAEAFEHPAEVLELNQVSHALKVRILQSWRLDAHRQLTNPGRDVPHMREFQTLQEINSALDELQAANK